VEPIQRVRVRAREGDSEAERSDALAVEEPLEIRLRGEERAPAVRFVTTMRTPGNDEELAAGLLFAEGVLAERSDLKALDRPSDPRVAADLRANVVLATLSPEALARAGRLTRGTVMGSACGVCGKTSIETVLPEGAEPLDAKLRVEPEILYGLPDRLREKQSVFAQTGGLHAAAFFTPDGGCAPGARTSAGTTHRQARRPPLAPRSCRCPIRFSWSRAAPVRIARRPSPPGSALASVSAPLQPGGGTR
jgi:FdhD protein